MATEPAELPEWTTADPTDPTSGQKAIIEPSPTKKASGFLFEEEPPRQDFNWFMNLVYLWIAWLKQQENINTALLALEVADTQEYSFIQADTNSLSGTYTLASGKINWHISGKKLWVFWTLSGELTGSASLTITVDCTTNTSLPTGLWNSLLDSVAEIEATGPYFVQGNSSGLTIKAQGAALIPIGVHSFGGSFFIQMP